MPIVRIDIQSGKTTSYKRALLHGVRAAIQDALGVDADRVTQRIIETPAEDIDTVESRADGLTIIGITMLPGRGRKLKRELYRQIISRLGEAPGIHANDIMITIASPTAECFFLNGRMMCDPDPDAEVEAAATGEEAQE